MCNCTTRQKLTRLYWLATFGLFAAAIHSIHTRESVSKLFDTFEPVPQ